MTRRVGLIAAAALAALALLWWALHPGPATGPGPGAAPPLPSPTPAPPERVLLLFPGGDGLLHPELRTVPLPAEIDARVRTVMTELLAGSSSFAPVVPYKAELLGVYIDDRGHAFVDLTPPPEPLEGSCTELLLAYGVVDSILLNCPELSGVQLLFGGQQVPTLTGHLDLSHPLRLNKAFVAGST